MKTIAFIVPAFITFIPTLNTHKKFQNFKTLERRYTHILEIYILNA
jgi:hypothetical protein